MSFLNTRWKRRGRKGQTWKAGPRLEVSYPCICICICFVFVFVFVLYLYLYFLLYNIMSHHTHTFVFVNCPGLSWSRSRGRAGLWGRLSFAFRDKVSNWLTYKTINKVHGNNIRYINYKKTRYGKNIRLNSKTINKVNNTCRQH